MTSGSPPQGTPAGPAPEGPSPQGQRQILQGLLAQHHGLLHTVMNQCLSPSSSDPEMRKLLGQLWDAYDRDMRELLEHLWDAYPGVSIAFGEVQGELNTASHDDGIDGVGLAKDQLGPKRKGFRYNLRRFYGGLRNLGDRKGFIQAAKHGVRAVKWGNIIVGSLSRELHKIKGIEVILEFGEAVVETLDQVIERHEAAGADKDQ
jgi:hypothetical protein